ncbi:MAG TPA: hypothetical protein VG253_29205, partial [Streptosporangiaceae bacterium]|nr:hypothetical protein [Streptosporangiaceae bacterium]
MGRRQWWRTVFAPAAVVLLVAGAAPAVASAAAPAGHAAVQATSAGGSSTPAWMKKYLHPSGSLYCGGIAAFNCVDVNGRTAASAGHTPWYVGHDEPSALFYSKQAGSGNNSNYLLRLPKDPALFPKNNGTGGVWNFQQHPAFWFGMAMCDTQSFPEYNNKSCQADSNSNIFASTSPSSPHFISKHTGAAYMEMQFYPPGWAPWPAGVSCDPTKWCAALNIDSYNASSAGVNNNSACLNSVGVEPVNFAFITLNGKPQAPANPVDSTAATYTPDPAKDLFMNPGDRIGVNMHDTSAGFQVVLNDYTTHQNGSMTASAANSFGQVLYQPTGTKCNVAPYSFHPMYSTSGPTTRVVWAAHSYNVAFSDEIGHFEYCGAVNTSNGSCTKAGVTEANGKLDSDDVGCFAGSQSTRVKINGCISSDGDFDGPEYTAAGWAPSPNTADPVTFTSPTFSGSHAYSQTAFENDLPR